MGVQDVIGKVVLSLFNIPVPTTSKYITKEQKEEIINRVKDKGERVSELAKEYGVVPKTIYNLLTNKTQGSNTLLELSRLQERK